MSIRGLIPKPIKKILRAGGERAIPRRWWLPVHAQWHKLRGSLEDEALILKQLTPLRTLAVDIGASDGYYSYFMSRVFERVEAFEANPRIVQKLRDYAAPNVQINTVALSSDLGTSTLYVPVVNGVKLTGWASLDREKLPSCESFHGIEVQTVTLDSLKLANVALIKIDVEGHEMNVLAGARETIRTSRPVIIIEIKYNNRADADAFFSKLNYKAFLAEGSIIREMVESLQAYSGSKEVFILKPAC